MHVKPGRLERAHFLAYLAPGDPPIHPREGIVALTRRRMWLISPLLRPQRRATGNPDGDGACCRDWTEVMVHQAGELPPLSLVLWNRVRLIAAWLVFAFGLLSRGKVPIGPGSHTIAIPSRGLAGPWQRAAPLAFGCLLGPEAMRVSCLAPIPRPSPSLRPLLAKAAACAPRPTARERVVISANGWVMRPRAEADLCAVPDMVSAQA